jgi:hypothetical protein
MMVNCAYRNWQCSFLAKYYQYDQIRGEKMRQANSTNGTAMYKVATDKQEGKIPFGKPQRVQEDYNES